MGQYYRTAVIHGNPLTAKPKVFECYGFVKLMEHSWMKNAHVNQVMLEILGNPAVVLWVGDYSNREGDGFCGYTHEQWSKLWAKVFNAKKEPEWLSDDPSKRADISEKDVDEFIEGFSTGFLINRTKGVYVDLSKILRQAEANGQWAVHPLPILTACGNLRGSGDYMGSHMDLVGSWAGDLIESSYTRPEGLTETEAFFEENKWTDG